MKYLCSPSTSFHPPQLGPRAPKLMHSLYDTEVETRRFWSLLRGPEVIFFSRPPFCHTVSPHPIPCATFTTRELLQYLFRSGHYCPSVTQLQKATCHGHVAIVWPPPSRRLIILPEKGFAPFLSFSPPFFLGGSSSCLFFWQHCKWESQVALANYPLALGVGGGGERPGHC